MKARCRTSSPKRFRIEDSTSGWRYSGRSVSGRRSQAATSATTPMIASTQKIARQPRNHRTCPPISGASMGAIEVQAIISDMARAAWSFSARSRTMVRASTTPPQAARPCRKRSSTSWPASAAKAQPMLATT